MFLGRRGGRYVFEERGGRMRQVPRFLTPRECARLMGFPDAFPTPPAGDVKRTAEFYHQIGNAVCPPVIEVIGAEMLRLLRAVST